MLPSSLSYLINLESELSCFTKKQSHRKDESNKPRPQTRLRRSWQGVPAGSWRDPVPGAGCHTLTPSSALPHHSPSRMKHVHSSCKELGSRCSAGKGSGTAGQHRKGLAKSTERPAPAAGTRANSYGGALRQRPAARHTYRPGGCCPRQVLPSTEITSTTLKLPCNRGFLSPEPPQRWVLFGPRWCAFSAELHWPVSETVL